MICSRLRRVPIALIVLLIVLGVSFILIALHYTNTDNIPHTAPAPTQAPNTVFWLHRAGHSISVPERCPELGVWLTLLVMVSSTPAHADMRDAIRLTWGHFSLRSDVVIVFLVGKTSSQATMARIALEAKLYGDIVQGEFTDTYDNLPLKTLSLLEWVVMHCPRSKYVLKADEDVFINIPNLLRFLASHDAPRTIYGKLYRSIPPVRWPNDRYYMPLEQYPHPVYPDYITGPAYLLTGDIIGDLYTGALNTTFMRMEDVMITGVVAEALGIRRVGVPEMANIPLPAISMCYQELISAHDITPHLQLYLWRLSLNKKKTCK